jgi:hypothetical protein
MKYAYKILVRKPAGKEPLGRPRRRCNDTVMQIGWVDVDWIHVAQNRNEWWALVNMVMNLRVP